MPIHGFYLKPQRIFRLGNWANPSVKSAHLKISLKKSAWTGGNIKMDMGIEMAKKEIEINLNNLPADNSILLKKARKKSDVQIAQIQKRDGSTVNFDIARIEQAVFKAMQAVSEGTQDEAKLISQKVLEDLIEIAVRYKTFTPDVEGIQNAVERELMVNGYVNSAKAYILYREKQALMRAHRAEVPAHVKALAEESRAYFRNTLSEFVYLRTYARWIESEARRETWIETIDRYMNFMRSKAQDKFTQAEYDMVRDSILKQEVMPSMRLLQFAGKAAETTNVCAYNCSFIAPSSIRDFAEVMYISMCGTGVGFSVESQNIQMLPQIKSQSGEILPTHFVADSKEGWCEALVTGMEAWFSGKDILFDYSLVRPAGARLKTIGGKSSGPEPLRSLLDFARSKILSRQGRRLTNINAHDILCKIGEVVVAGGVRRSAMISLSDLDDVAMRDAKCGQFYFTDPQRSIANNSAVYDEKPSNQVLLDEWVALIKSGSGERGIFNRSGLVKTLPERRIKAWKEKGLIKKNKIVGFVGTNPCAEIILQSKQFCNLSEIIARADDTQESLLRKLKVATLLGTFQSMLTDFPFLSKEWKENCERERLLGVSVTGQWDCSLARDPMMLTILRDASINLNQEYAARLNISPSTCITCVKPSGTVSQTVDCASGMHPRHAPYYIRRIRISATDALFKMMKDQGIPYHPEVGQSMNDATTYVLEFPVKAPDGAICKDDISALDQLEHWKVVKLNFTEHNPSVTVSVGDDEWIGVLAWLDKNWEIVGGLSFLPRSNHVYQLAPYEEINKEQYEKLLAQMGNVDFSKLVSYERTDETEAKRELACAGGHCEI